MYKNVWEKGILRVKLIIIKKKLTAHCQAIPSHSLGLSKYVAMNKETLKF